MSTSNRVTILDVPIARLTMDEALVQIEQFIESKKAHQVATINNEFLLTAQTDSAFKKVLQQADLPLADSAGVVWAARYLGSPLPERIPGVDLVNQLLEKGSKKGWSFYLVGAGPGVASQAAANLRKRFSKIKIVGAEEGIGPNSSDKEVKDLVQRISNAKPDILLVAFGAPKQDLFIHQHKKELGVPVMIGVGGTLDFLAGKVKRAPKWMRRLQLEWCWRLLQEPNRLPRIINAILIFPLKVIFSKGSHGPVSE